MKTVTHLISMFILLIAYIVPIPVMAKDPVPEHELEAVSITATRVARKTAEMSSSVTVIDEEVIEETKMFNVKEVLRSTPGVLIDTKNQGYDSRLIIRGAGLKARYGIRDIMVLLDGVPITDPDSMTRMDFIDTQLIEQIEVVKGPQSALCWPSVEPECRGEMRTRWG